MGVQFKPGDREICIGRKLRDMDTKAVVAARDVQRVLADVHEALHDEVRVLKSARSKRAADDAVRRI